MPRILLLIFGLIPWAALLGLGIFLTTLHQVGPIISGVLISVITNIMMCIFLVFGFPKRK